MLCQQLVNGVLVGLIYGLLALGFSLAYSTTRVINFAHGEMFTLGAFLGLALQRSGGLPFAVAAPASVLLVGVAGAVFGYLVLRPLGSALVRSVATIALSLVLRDGMLIAFGSDSVSYPPVYPPGSLSAGWLAVPRSSVVIAAITLVLLVGFGAVLSRSRWGIWTRATAQDEELAATVGIPTGHIQALAFGAGSALAAAAGVLITPTWQVHYAAGMVVGLKAYTAAMFGGLGNLSGALAGGILLGAAEALLAGYVSSTWKDLAVYLCLFVVLVFLPRGLFSVRSVRLG